MTEEHSVGSARGVEIRIKIPHIARKTPAGVRFTAIVRSMMRSLM
jgi:hypothetical protein